MKATLSTLSKILIGFCALCALYCGVMVAYSLRFPQEEYDLQKFELQQQINAEKEKIAENNKALTQQQETAAQLQSQLSQLQNEKDEKIATNTELQNGVDELSNLYDTILQTRIEYGQKVRQLEDLITAGKTDIKICYLTFDDGPNNLTQSIVERLAEHEAYATFFTIGTNKADGQAANLRREIMGGHTVANHTFSHYFNGSLYRELDIFTNQVKKQDEKVFEATGFHTELFRFPSGSAFCPFKDEAIKWLEENGYKWVDWNASAWDAGFANMQYDGLTISNHILKTIADQKIAVVLCHDFNNGTYKALDIVIPELKSRGYVFLPMFPESITLEEPLNVV